MNVHPHIPPAKADVLDVGLVETVPQDGLCYTCGKRGHGRYNCPNGRFIDTCNLCGKQGHVTSKCPSNQQGYGSTIIIFEVVNYACHIV